MENKIYFRLGDKTFDIAENRNISSTWYEWVERRKNMVRKMNLSRESLLSICQLLHKASAARGNTFMRWNSRDHLSYFYCSQKFNTYGRFFSIVAVQGQRRSVIILPENDFNAGWDVVAAKIEGFLNRGGPPVKEVSASHPTFQLDFKETISRSRWLARNQNLCIEQDGNSCIKISGSSAMTDKDLLNRSVVGRFIGSNISIPSSAEVRRWVSKNWSNAVGVYDMNGYQFLFEFPTRRLAEHTMAGEWKWQQATLDLRWWSPTAGCINEEVKLDWAWIRILGLPLHLWTQQIFTEIGDRCGGWLETEEETGLKNHLRWARIRVKGEPDLVPKQVELQHEGFVFTLPIWVENPARVRRIPMREGEDGEDRVCRLTGYDKLETEVYVDGTNELRDSMGVLNF